MDRVALTGIEVRARHGVFPEERERDHRFVVDAVLELDLAPASRSDDLDDTVDYGALLDAIAATAAGGPHQLIETVAGAVLDVCLEDPRVAAATVTVHKPQAPVAVPVADVSVTLRRERAPR